jgi:hypothetical protein
MKRPINRFPKRKPAEGRSADIPVRSKRRTAVGAGFACGLAEAPCCGQECPRSGALHWLPYALKRTFRHRAPGLSQAVFVCGSPQTPEGWPVYRGRGLWTFLFFSGAAGRLMSTRVQAAPLKNKKRGEWSAAGCKQATPPGFLTRQASLFPGAPNGCRGELASIIFTTL